VAPATVAGETDGRVQRGARNRAAIVEALLALLEDGEARPSARSIADRAGVSLRSVFQHFDDMESLYAECVQRQEERIAPRLEPIDAGSSRSARIEALVAQRARVYERITPVRRAALLLAPSSAVIRDGLRRISARFRHQLADVFDLELAAAADHRELLAALDVTTSFDAWDQLRTVQGLSVAAARRVVARIIEGTLREALR
jgi:AcrR family transcriptional regulator